MVRIARHLLHYRSSLDGVEQPYLVSAPQEVPPDRRLPVVVLLHDVLPDPSAGGFIEEGFRQTSQWLDVLAEGPPALLVQPYGRGNAGWLGPGAGDLFDVCNRIARQFPCDFSALSLVGIGGGATGALQLAAWFPGWFAAVAACGAWGDERHDLPFDARDWPPWERAQRRALSPCALASNLAHTELYLEHPWWHHGLAATAPSQHTTALRRQLDALGIGYQFRETEKRIGDRVCPSERRRVWEWLVSRRRPAQTSTVHLTTYSPRLGRCGPIQVLRLKPGAASTIEGTFDAGQCRLRTKNVSELAVQLPADSTSIAMQVDRRSLPLERLAEVSSGPVWVRLERLGTRWHAAAEPWEAALWPGGAADPVPHSHAADPPLLSALKTPLLAGPAMDLRWGSVAFVTASLGDEVHAEVSRRLAEQLRRAWQSGTDSLNPHPGDRTCTVEYPLLADTEVTDEQIAQHHLILIGCPATNLLVARFRAGIACQWISREDGRTSAIVLNGQTYDRPDDLVVLLGPNPEAPGRYLLVITAVEGQGLVSAARLHTASLPDFLVLRAGRVHDWGYCGPDWQPPNV